MNLVIIRKTLSQLKKAGLIHVARGTGGAELAKAADEISLLDIYQAVECLGSTGQLFGFHENPNPNSPNRSQYPSCLRWEARRHSDCYGKRDGSNQPKRSRRRRAEKNGPRIGFIRKESGTEIGHSLEFDFVVPPPNS